MKKGSKAYSVLFGKCPKCHKGKFFKYSISYNPSKITSINDNCPCCKFKFMIEPSFFYGAMYVNYGLTVALAIIVFVLTNVVLKQPFLDSFIYIASSMILFAPIIIRLSRILWINLFVNYNSEMNCK